VRTRDTHTHTHTHTHTQREREREREKEREREYFYRYIKIKNKGIKNIEEYSKEIMIVNEFFISESSSLLDQRYGNKYHFSTTAIVFIEIPNLI